MSRQIDRNKIRKLILKEFKMMSMTDMGHAGMQPMGMHHHDESGAISQNHPTGHAHSSPKNCVSREDCCAAIMCLVECCECPITKQLILECCQDIMSGAYDQK